MNNKPVGKKFVILQFFLLKKISIESEVCFLCPSSAYQMKNILHSTFTFRPAICAKIFIALSIFFTYPLQFYVVFDIFKKHIDPYIKDNYRTVTDIMARTFGVLCSVGIGIALPLLEQIINIVGACFYSILGLVIPGIIETVFRWENLGKCKWILWKNVLIIIFGVFSLVSGCTVTIMDIIEILHRKIE